MRDSLEEERRAALLERVECELELGRHADLVGELHHLLAQYPLDETFIAHQMTALYRSGRPGDALSLYRDTRHRLVEEQGTEPGPALAELHQRILGRDPALAVERGRPSGPSGQRPRGRAADGHAAARDGASSSAGTRNWLSSGEPGPDPQVVVIEGMPGVGKTALAVHAARSSAGSTRTGGSTSTCVPRPGRPSLDAAEALHRLLRMLAVPALQIPDLLGDRVALWRAQLSRRQAVVILDDVASMTRSARCCRRRPGLILVTTRRRLLGLGDARTLTLDVLSPDDAVALFRRDAGDARAGDTDQVTRWRTYAGGCRWPSSSRARAAPHDQRCGWAT